MPQHFMRKLSRVLKDFNIANDNRRDVCQQNTPKSVHERRRELFELGVKVVLTLALGLINNFRHDTWFFHLVIQASVFFLKTHNDMSQSYLFYSQRCPNSKQILDTLKALNKISLYKLIEVETIPRAQIPAFLKSVPTLYNNETKDVIVGKDIYGYIAKPTNSRKEIPEKEGSVTANGSVAKDQPIGELTPWGFEGMGSLTESYSMWDSPTSFAIGGGSMYTFLDGAGGPISVNAGAGMPSSDGPTTSNTLDDKSKTGSNDDVKRKLEQIQKQRETEFSGVSRK